MTQIELEKWVCTENIDRFRVGLQDQTDDARRKQLEDLFTREMAKLRIMFPDREVD
jgi:hypothetical protein